MGEGRGEGTRRGDAARGRGEGTQVGVVETSVEGVGLHSGRRVRVVLRARRRPVTGRVAALGGLGLCEGVGLGVVGPELPLLEGGEPAWCDAIAALGVAASTPRARVA